MKQETLPPGSRASDLKLCFNPKCGKSFMPYRNYQKFCSDACRFIVTKRRRDRDKVGETSRVCDECGKDFMSKGKHHRFCSRECTDAYWAHRNKTPDERKCLHCGNLFQSTHWSKRYCSKECYSAKAKERRKAS